jgi:hypothetical protein
MWNDGSKTVIQYSNIPTLPCSVPRISFGLNLPQQGEKLSSFYSVSHGWLFWESRWIASWHAKTHHGIARPVHGEQYLNHHDGLMATNNRTED